jgi:hypothetical protein
MLKSQDTSGLVTFTGLFVLVIIHMYWVGLSRFKSITSQNSSQSHPIHTNTHVISITEQALHEFIACVASRHDP